MQQYNQNKMSWQYLAGFYDGEGTIGFRVVKEKRLSRSKGELGGWYITPYLQLANNNLKVLQITQKFLRENGILSHIVIKNSKIESQQKGYYLTIQSYGGIRKFLESLSLYSLMKNEQVDIMNRFFDIRDNLPLLKKGTKIDNLKRNYWTKELFLKAMKLRDKLKDTKFRRNVKHKYNYDYFKKLWS